MFYTYVIESIEQKYSYTGLTNNFERRLLEHNSGNNKTTKPYKPFKVILVEQFETRILARKREKYLKSGCGREFIKSIKNT
jgi:putative endonuclease